MITTRDLSKLPYTFLRKLAVALSLDIDKGSDKRAALEAVFKAMKVAP